MYTWGYGQYGQLGHKDKESRVTPKKVQFDHKVEKLFCGGGHTGLITENGDLYLMGRGRDGQLGRGNKVESTAFSRTKPTLVEFFQDGSLRVDNLALGTSHTLATATVRK